MSLKGIMLADAMLSLMAGGDLPYKGNPYLAPPTDRRWKERKPKDGKPKTRAVYYYDDKGNLRRRKEKL